LLRPEIQAGALLPLVEERVKTGAIHPRHEEGDLGRPFRRIRLAKSLDGSEAGRDQVGPQELVTATVLPKSGAI